MKWIITTLLITQLAQADNWAELNPNTQVKLNQALALSQFVKDDNKPQGIAFVTVGNDNDCDFRLGSAKIQAAIDSGASELRMAANEIYEEIIVINSSTVNLTLRGGFADCSAAENNIQSNNPENFTEITRAIGQSGSVFNINGLPQGNVTTFENLRILGGDGQNTTSGGGLNITSSDSDVLLNNVWLTQGNNNATGGGLSIISSNSTVTLNNSAIFDNSATQGGGIYCNDFSGLNKKATIILGDDSSLYNNNSTTHGGGAFISKGCLLASFSGNSTVNTSLGIFNNTAESDGGGIYAMDGANVLIYGHTLCDLSGACFGNNTSPASVNSNHSNFNAPNTNLGDGHGGGIYATGASTDVTITAGHLRDNSATGVRNGGAIAVYDNATLTVNHPGQACWSSDRCTLIEGNSAHSGGAVYSESSVTEISHAYFEQNNANFGLVFFSKDGATNIEYSMLVNNGNDVTGLYDNNHVVSVTGNNVMNVVHSTIADNLAEESVFGASTIGSTTLNLYASIVHDANSGNVIDSNPRTVFSNCNITHETASLTGTNNTVIDPEFVDAVQGDYHLLASSPAIDYCHQVLNGLNKDIDFQNQGYDVLSISDFLGPYDIGADEFYDKTYLTVGADASCDINTATHTIQDAIDTGIAEIRIANNGNHNTSLSVDNSSIKLRGGYVDCVAANNDIQSTQTEIIVTIGSIEPVIKITGDNQRNYIELENFIMTGLDNSALIVESADAEITLTNSLIHNNSAPGLLGGGVFISQSNVDFNLIDTIITENSAAYGGGLFCEGSGANVVMSGNSGLSLNTTTGKGGGAYITLGCQFTMYSGTANPTPLSTKGVSANIADEEGGGIYVDLGGQVTLNGHQNCTQTCIGDNINPVSINHNKSNSGVSSGERGGGIYLTGIGTTVEVYAGLFSENHSPNGGAIYVNDLASFTMARLTEKCWDPVKCNYIFKNRALGAGTGGAIQNDQGFINISNTYFEENDGRSGSVLYAFGSNSHNKIDSSVFNHNNNQGNGDDYVIRAANSASVDIVHSTFADNYISNTTVFGITTDSELRLYSSIVHDQEGDVLDVNPGTVIIDCLMAHETDSYTGTNVFLEDPGFIDRNNRDYHLTANSLAIDVCTENLLSLDSRDIDFANRGIDSHNIDDINGLYDLGADEAANNDIIFKNSFEAAP